MGNCLQLVLCKHVEDSDIIPQKNRTYPVVQYSERNEIYKKFYEERKKKVFRDTLPATYKYSITLVLNEEEQYRVLSRVTSFSIPTVRKLKSIFMNISNLYISDIPRINANKLAQSMGIPEDSIFVQSLLRAISGNNNSFNVNFRSWILFLSIINQNSIDKVKLSFTIYDLNCDGVINVQELYTLLKGAVDGADIELRDNEISDLCSQMLRCSDSNNDGNIDINEYQQALQTYPNSLEYFSVDINDTSTSLIDSNSIQNVTSMLSFTNAQRRQDEFCTKRLKPLSNSIDILNDSITLRITKEDDIDDLDI